MKRSSSILAAVAMVASLAGCGEEGRDFAEVLQEVRVCADGPTVDGIDVSYWQDTINWDSVASTSVKFAIIRTSDGYYEDPQFARNWTEAKRVGLYRGVYHYFRPAKDPESQADIVVGKIGQLSAGDLPPVIDLEDESLYTPYTLAQNIDKVARFINRVEAGTGRQVMIYAGKYFWQDAFDSSNAFVDHPLWIPQYGPTCPDIPAPWTRWAFFQTSSQGRVAGIGGNVDLDLFNGDLSALAALANGEALPGGGGGGGGDGLIQGVVYEDRGQGSADMSVRIPGATVSIGGAGYWSASVDAGTYTVSASAAGYTSASRSCSVAAGGEIWCSIGLVPAGGGGDDGTGGGDDGTGGGDDGTGGGDDMGSAPADDTGGTGGGDDGTGGGDDGTGGGDDGTGDVIIDPDSPHGLVKGYVIEMTLEDDTLEGCDGPHVPGAKVEAENTESTMADGDGYFEFLVLEGDHVLGASKEGYLTGAAECTVVANGEVTCCIPIVKDPLAELPDDDGAGGEDDMGSETVVVVSCATGGEAGSLGLLLPLLGLAFVLRLRRK